MLSVFFGTISEGIYRIYSLLFHPATMSFNLIAETNADGTWRQSYSQHVILKQQTRRFVSVGSAVLVVASVVVSNYVIAVIQ